MSDVPFDPYVRSATLHRVVDGDTVYLTVDLGFDRISTVKDFRLVGINAPELKHDVTGAGHRAKEVLIELLLNQPLVITSVKAHGDLYKRYKKGKYGRFLAVIYHAETGININQRMIELGHAVPYDGGTR